MNCHMISLRDIVVFIVSCAEESIHVSHVFIDYLYETLCKFIVENIEIFNLMDTYYNIEYEDFRKNLRWLISHYDKIQNITKEIYGMPYFLNAPPNTIIIWQVSTLMTIGVVIQKASHGWCYTMEGLRKLGVSKTKKTKKKKQKLTLQFLFFY